MIGLAIFGIFTITIVGVILRGWALTYLWYWFIVPLGMPELGIAHAIGITGIVTFLTHQVINCQKEKTDKYKAIGNLIGVTMAAPLFALLFGYIAHSFM